MPSDPQWVEFQGANPNQKVIAVPAMGYSNFFISNGVVLVSEYWKEGLPEKEKLKDEKVKSILKE